MISWAMTVIFLVAAFHAATEALWRWRTATARSDVATALLCACGSAGALYVAWTWGAR